MIHVGIDPGIDISSYAVVTNNKLYYVSCVRAAPHWDAWTYLRRQLSIAHELSRHLMKFSTPFVQSHFLFEHPVIYPNAASRKGDQNTSVVRPAGIVLATIGFMNQNFVRFSDIEPAQWKGQLKKHETQHHINKKLDAGERKVLALALEQLPASLQHNLWDAVGIALHAAGRGFR